jgi:hypothetical protein
MTTLHRDRNWKITMYVNDHGPPHFHVRTPDGRAIISIQSLSVMEGKLPKTTLALVHDWAAAHASLLNATWDALHKRDNQ